MSSGATYLAAAAALGAASEATGTTALTPLGQQARDDQGGNSGGGPGFAFPAPDRGGGVSGEVLAQLADAFQNQQQQQPAGPDPLEILELAQQGNGAADQLEALLEDQRKRTDEWRRRWEAAQQGDVDGDGNSDVPDVPGVPGIGGDDSSSDEQDDGDDFKLQDLDGRGPYGIGTLLAAGGETGAATGEAAGDTVGFFNEIGNTGAQVFRAVSGKEYSAEDTLAEDIHGTATRRINFDDYNPLSGVSADLELEEPDQTMTEMAVENVKSKMPDAGGNDDSSSTEKGTESGGLGRGGIFPGGDEKDDEEPIISLPPGVTSGGRKSVTQGVR